MFPYNGVQLRMPGRHAEDCSVKGGDFVVIVDDSDINWSSHRFTHSDLFHDIALKTTADKANAELLMEHYYSVVVDGADPAKLVWERGEFTNSLHPQTFLYAVQCLAVAENRRYGQHNAKGGGKFLPLRFSAGVVAGNWSASEGSKVQKYGRPAVERLEREQGLPALTKKLLDTLSQA